MFRVLHSGFVDGDQQDGQGAGRPDGAFCLGFRVLGLWTEISKLDKALEGQTVSYVQGFGFWVYGRRSASWTRRWKARQ